MNVPRRLTRRQAISSIGGLGGAVWPHRLRERRQTRLLALKTSCHQRQAGPGLEGFDEVTLKTMDRHGVPGAAGHRPQGQASPRQGLRLGRRHHGRTVRPTDPFGLASLSKTFTAVATLVLVEQGKLGLDNPVLGHLKDVRLPRGARMDPRLKQVTIRQCLNHSGGWDRQANGDPINWGPQISRALKVRPPISATHFATFMLGVPLNFDPGTEAKYSNVGYILLGEVITRIAGQPYDAFVRDHVFKPLGIQKAVMHDASWTYSEGEAHRYLSGRLVGLPSLQLPMLQAAGGWSCSVVDLVRFLTNLDGSRGKPVLSEKSRALMVEKPPKPLKPRDNGTYFGLGWDSVVVQEKEIGYFKDGSYQGMRTFMKRLPNGVNGALAYNASMDFDAVDMKIIADLVHEIRQEIERLKDLPDVDLFKDFGG